MSMHGNEYLLITQKMAYFFGIKNCEIFLLSNFDTKELPITIPSFYREAILSWKELRNQQVFLN